MSVEAEGLANALENEAQGDRRARSERRSRDRRKVGNRVNLGAPRQSLMKALGAYGVAISAGAFALTLVGGQMLGQDGTIIAIGFEAAALAVSIIVLAIGSLELRLIEIRLELMMMNGGMRQTDRRGGDRRDGPST